MKDIILFGAPGCGKGTQAELLIEKLEGMISHLSTGDVFRAIVSGPNAIGRYVKDRMESGKLIDDQVTMSLFNAYFFTVLDEQKYMLLDGYPRSVPQMQGLETIAKDNNRSVIGIYFEVDEEETVKRILSRGREGETEEVIRTRMSEYYKHTHPIVEEFAQRWELVKIDANRSIEEIHADVMKAVV
jgi:adenylate kinase